MRYRPAAACPWNAVRSLGNPFERCIHNVGIPIGCGTQNVKHCASVCGRGWVGGERIRDSVPLCGCVGAPSMGGRDVCGWVGGRVGVAGWT